MRAHIFGVALIAGALAFGGRPAHATTRPTAAPAARRAAAPWRGIGWETSLTSAKAKAARAGKPLLVLHLFGRLDEEFC